MDTQSTRMWADAGVEFASEKLSKGAGSDKVELRGTFDIPIITDLGKFTAKYGPTYILKMSNGTSLRVKAQAMHRRVYPARLTDAELSSQLNVLFTTGGGGGARTRTVTVVTLPNGEKYTGTDGVEYAQLFTAALVDLGVPLEVATAKAIEAAAIAFPDEDGE